MTVEDTAIAVASVPHDDARLRCWVSKLRSRVPHFSHANDHQPGAWIGAYLRGRLVCAYGYTFCHDGTILIDYAVCEPTRAGRVCLEAMGLILKKTWAGRPIRFFTELSNRKMRKIFEHKFGAKPVALLYEVLGG